MNSTTTVYRGSHFSRGFAGALTRTRETGRFLDVILKCEGIEIQAHKIVLSCCSVYFDRLFAFDNSLDQVELHDIEAEALNAIVDFFYSGLLTINTQNVKSLLAASDLLLLEDVKNAAVNFLHRIIGAENCIEIWRLAETFAEDQLAKGAKRFLERNFKAVSETTLFNDVMTENAFAIILKSRRLSIAGEDQLLDVLVNWVAHD